MNTFYTEHPKAKGNAVKITIAELIPTGRENAISRASLLALCDAHDLAHDDRRMRELIHHARIDYVILNREDGGYYRPTLADMQDLQRYIRQEQSRAIKIFQSIQKAQDLYEDYKRGRMQDE